MLVVDDNAGNLLALRTVLEPLGEHIVGVASGEAALEYLLSHDCAAIVLDAHLPGMTGFDVAEVLRGRARTRDIPILFVTGTVLDGATAGYAQGAFDYIVETCNVADLCKEIVDELAYVHPGRTIRLEAENAGDGAWDPLRLQQMISNLVANGLQHSPPESEVVVRVAPQGHELLVEVANKGEPIPPEAQKTLFEPFKRTDDSQPRAAHPGLGLYIVEQVVRAHGGSVEVQSSEQSGTRFTVHLPRPS